MAENGPGPRRVPPQDLAAEQGVLGGVLLHGEDALAGVAATLSPGDFYDGRHAAVYQSMLELHDRGIPPDEITVSSHLRDSGKLEFVGGASYLAQLSDMVLATAQVDHYARLVKEKSYLRDFITAAHKAMEEAYTNQADPDQALEEGERAIFNATQRRFTSEVAPMSKLAITAVEMIEQRFKKKGLINGVPTGFTRLDKLTTGLQPGDLIIIAGRPSMGKTAFALNVAANAAMSGEDQVVGVFSLEMSKEQLAIRLLCSEARVSGEKVRSGFLSANDFQAITAAAERLGRANIYIDDTPALSVLELRAKARRLKQKGLGLIVVDYLQLMTGRAGAKRREQEISDISRSLKALAKELNLPVVALSQLNRKVEERPGDKRPMLSDLRESGAIEQDADVIAFIYRKKVYKKKDDEAEEDDNIAEIIIGKQRNGPTGTVKLVFLDDLTRFENPTFDDTAGGDF